MHQDFKICLVNAFRMGMNMKISMWKIAHHVNQFDHILLIKNAWTTEAQCLKENFPKVPISLLSTHMWCGCAVVQLCGCAVVQLCSCTVVQLCGCAHTHVVRIARQRALRWDVWQEMSDFSSLVQDRFLTAPIFGPSGQIFCTLAHHKV